jgi:hypothetical protein
MKSSIMMCSGMRYLIAIICLLLCSCSVRETLDIGSAKALKEVQEGHNDLLPVVQALAANESRLVGALQEEHPENHIIKESAKEAARVSARASELAKVELSPYSSLGPLAGLISKLNWLFSYEGAMYVLGILTTIMTGRSIHLGGKVRRAIQAPPGTNPKDI